MAGRRVPNSPPRSLTTWKARSPAASRTAGWRAATTGPGAPAGASAKRGVPSARVRAVHGGRVAVELPAPIKRGDGVVFADRRPRRDPQGGRVYEVFRGGSRSKEPVAARRVELAFGREATRLAPAPAGPAGVKTDDPQLRRRLRQTFSGGRGPPRAAGRDRRGGGRAAVVASVRRPTRARPAASNRRSARPGGAASAHRGGAPRAVGPRWAAACTGCGASRHGSTAGPWSR